MITFVKFLPVPDFSVATVFFAILFNDYTDYLMITQIILKMITPILKDYTDIPLYPIPLFLLDFFMNGFLFQNGVIFLQLQPFGVVFFVLGSDIP